MAVSNQTRNRSFRGGGGIYLRELGGVVNGSFFLGNADNFQFTINEQKQTQRNFTQPGGGNIASESTITDVTGNVNALSINPRTAAVALRALVNTVPAGAVSAESITVSLDMLVRTSKIPDFSQAVTVTDATATTTYVSGTDYVLRNNAFYIDPDGAIAEGEQLLFNYTSKATYDIEAITKSGVEYEMFFDGFNEADEGKSVTVTVHRVSFSPAQALSLITEDFGSLPMEFEALADTNKDGSTESQYFTVSMEQ